MMATLRASSDATDRNRLIRFLLTGVVNTGFGYGVYAMLVLIGLPPQVALAMSFVAGVIWNYVIHIRYVFGTEGYAKLPAYAAVYLFIYLLNAVILHMVLRAGISALLAQAVLALCMALISFFLLSFVLTGRFPGQRSPD